MVLTFSSKKLQASLKQLCLTRKVTMVLGDPYVRR